MKPKTVKQPSQAKTPTTTATTKAKAKRPARAKRPPPPSLSRGATIYIRCTPAQRNRLKEAANHVLRRATGMGAARMPVDAYTLEVALAAADRELEGDDVPAVRAVG